MFICDLNLTIKHFHDRLYYHQLFVNSVIQVITRYITVANYDHYLHLKFDWQELNEALNNLDTVNSTGETLTSLVCCCCYE